MIDTQALTGSIATDAPLSHVPMTSMITLGSRELPYFITAAAFGQVSLHQDDNSMIATLSNPPLPAEAGRLTSIVYDADNSYFVDQTYILEGGGIIVAQANGESVMRADSSISIKHLYSDHKIEMKFYIPNFIGVAGKNISYNSGNCFIRTNYSSYQQYATNIYYPDGYIIIKSKYLNAWNESLNRLLGEEIKNNYTIVNITRHFQDPAYPTDPTKKIDVVMVSFNKKSPPDTQLIIDLKLTVVNIIVQVGPGWVQ